MVAAVTDHQGTLREAHALSSCPAAAHHAVPRARERAKGGDDGQRTGGARSVVYKVAVMLNSVEAQSIEIVATLKKRRETGWCPRGWASSAPGRRDVLLMGLPASSLRASAVARAVTRGFRNGVTGHCGTYEITEAPEGRPHQMSLPSAAESLGADAGARHPYCPARKRRRNHG